MHSLGHNFIPAPIHAGGLRYHGMAPLVSHAVMEGLISPVSIKQLECYEAALTFARTEGLIIAPETSHAVAQAIRSANEATKEGKERVIVFNLSGHGLMDLNGYAKYLGGELTNYELPQDELEKSIEMNQKQLLENRIKGTSKERNPDFICSGYFYYEKI